MGGTGCAVSEMRRIVSGMICIVMETGPIIGGTECAIKGRGYLGDRI